MNNLQNKIIQEYKIIKDISKDLHIFEISRSDYSKVSQTITLLVDRKYISEHFTDNKLYYMKNSTFDYFLEQYFAEIGEVTTNKDYAVVSKIKQFIQDGQALPKEDIDTGIRYRCSDPEFVKWLSKIQIFNETTLKKHPLYHNINTICFQKMNTGFNEMMGILQALLEELLGGNIDSREYLIEKEVETRMKTIQELITDFCDLHNYEGPVTLQCIPYVIFKNNLLEFIYANKLQSTDEWHSIQANLVTQSNQYMNDAEADIILKHLYTIQKNILSKSTYNHKQSLPHLKTTIDTTNISTLTHLNNKVFIVHGHDNEAKTEAARFVENLGLEAIILHEQVDGGKTIIEKIESYTDVGFGIILYTPCDVGGKDEHTLTQRARQNVVFEHGYLMAKLGRNRVCALVKEPVEFPSDISGVIYKTMDNGGAWKYDISKEMQSAGLNVDMRRIK